jgi:hypothetical protein
VIARIQERLGARAGRDTRHCEEFGCKKATTGRKPFCVEHVERLPYVQELQDRILDRQDEWEQVRSRGARAVDPSGLTALEIHQYVRVHGPCTIKRLAKDLSLSRSLLESYVRVLSSRRLLRVTENKRHVPVLHYVAADPTSSGTSLKKPVAA